MILVCYKLYYLHVICLECDTKATELWHRYYISLLSIDNHICKCKGYNSQLCGIEVESLEMSNITIIILFLHTQASITAVYL